MEEKIFYLTSQKLKELKEEYEKIKKIIRLKVQQTEVPSVLYSDQPNEEFFLFQEDLNFLLLRKQELEYIFKNHRLIKLPPKDQRDRVCLGARVVVEVAGQEDEFEIVGTLEANPSLGRISNESPVGNALIGKKVGDEVVLSSPISTVYKIKKIKYTSGKRQKNKKKI